MSGKQTGDGSPPPFEERADSQNSLQTLVSFSHLSDPTASNRPLAVSHQTAPPYSCDPSSDGVPYQCLTGPPLRQKSKSPTSTGEAEKTFRSYNSEITLGGEDASCKKELDVFKDSTDNGKIKKSVVWWFGWTKRIWLAVILPLSLLIFVVAFGILTYYILAPSFISYKLRTSLLETHSTTLFNLQEDGFWLNMTGQLHDAGAVAVTIAAMQNVTVRYRGKHLGTMSMPQMQTERGQSILPVEITSYFKIHDRDLWIHFNQDMMSEHAYVWQLTSATDISVLGCTFPNIAFEKSLTMLGILHLIFRLLPFLFRFY